MDEYFEMVNKNTTKVFYKEWCHNFKENSKKYDFNEFSAMKVKNTEKGSAYIIGASPSLKDDIEDLKGRETIIASSHALKFLLNNGVTPKYVVEADPMIDQAEYLNIGKTDITLLTTVIAHPKVLDVWKGKVLFFCNAEIPEAENVEAIVSPVGNVVNTAYLLATAMGFNRVVFVGNSLANNFLSKDVTLHADGSEDKSRVKDRDMLTVDIHGCGIMTNPMMYAYKCWLDQASIEFKDIEHINVSGGILGAYYEGNLSTIKQMKLSEVN
jgi:hypothetical protein